MLTRDIERNSESLANEIFIVYKYDFGFTVNRLTFKFVLEFNFFLVQILTSNERESAKPFSM